MKICHQCQQKNPYQAKFCNKCGASIVVSQISDKQKTKKAAERRQLTILFCDLVGSTTLSEQMDPEDYRQIILNYHQIVEEVITRYRGNVGNYLGDGLLIYFGYPEGLEDASKVSIQAGLSIIEAVKAANKRWIDEGKTSIKVRIGIHTGLVIVDDHLALGETVNIAARLEGLAPHNGLVISRQTMDLIQGWFEIKSTGKHVLKGISEPIEVFQVLKESGAKTRLDIAKGRGLSPLVGRESELLQLIKYWSQAKNGNGNLVLLNGEAGIGKSRLVDSIAEHITQNPEGFFLEARCSTYRNNSAFHPIIELFQNGLLQFEPSDGTEEKLSKLGRYLKKSSFDFDMAMPLFVEFLGINSEKFPPLHMSPFAKRERIMESITQAMLYQAMNQPILLVLEDLHWADASTLEWLKLFIEQLSNQYIFILCTTRPGFRPDWQEHLRVFQITLERLSAENMAEICLHQAKGKDLPKEILKQIATKTEGVPLFVEELTKMVLESNLLIEKDDSFKLIESLSSMAIPSTLQDSLLARLDRLSEVKEIVQIGSVLGREFSLAMLNAVLLQEIEDIEQSLSKLLDAEIFSQKNHGKQSVYQFKHALIQDAAYESLLKSRRQQLHHQVAKVLEDQFVEICQNEPEILAHHYTKAGQPIKAIPIWLKAGQQAGQKNATTEAIAHLEKGIELLPHVKNVEDRNNFELDFRLTLGGTFVVYHGFPHPKVKKTFNQARDIAQTIDASPKLALILFNLLSYYFNTEDYNAHEELADYMFKLAEDPDNGYWFELFASQLVGVAKVIKGEFEEANRSYQQVLEIFDPSLPFPWELSPTGYIEVGAKAWRMVCFQILGYMDQAKSLSDEHLSFSKGHKDSMTLYHIYTFPALYKLEAREWKAAESILEGYLPIVRAFGDPIFTMTAEVYYNIAKAFQGDTTAFEAAIYLINICFDIGFKAFAVTMSPYLGAQYFRNGEYESALKWIEKILAHVNQTGSHIHTAELFRIKGLTLQALGKPDETVEENLKYALELSKKQSAKTYELRCAADLAILWQKQGKINKANDLLKGVYDWFSEGFDSVDLYEARIILAELNKQLKS
ncbi:MAG: AAA family ATPase [Gracilimonas sp.]|uniref:AAA family ATPase n=1 Tax=Gracilimonas sp. TaxID=1974203 RepID=UPI00375344D9|nr:AAA family ATPase [Gracilimonas sp.]